MSLYAQIIRFALFCSVGLFIFTKHPLPPLNYHFVNEIFVNSGVTWGYLMLLYAYVLVARGVVVSILFPFLRYFGYGLDWKEAIILVWAGLRGAVALSLSLSVKAS